MLRTVTVNDAKAICKIYNHYIENTIVTFEGQIVSIDEMESRIRDTAASYPWLVYESDHDILGYAYASRWKARHAYRYSVEVTVYLAPGATGRGIGSKLYTELISKLQEQGVHSIIGGIALPNPASIALHEKMGFVKVAHFKEVGWKFNRWIDVGYWELIVRQKHKGMVRV